MRNGSAPRPQRAEEEEALREVGRYLQQRIINMGFISIPIPDEPEEECKAQTFILASESWETASKLLIMIHSGIGYPIGVFSRSLVFDEGLIKGSMIGYIEKAKANGYAVMILRPNVNSVESIDGLTNSIKKLSIVGSETPEIHAIGVWDTLVSKMDNLKHCVLLGFGNGAGLCKDIFTRQMVRSKNDANDKNRIKAVLTIEASQILDVDDAADIKSIFKDLAINLECNVAAVGSRLDYLREKLGGVNTVSLGLAPGMSAEMKNANASYAFALDTVFTYLKISEGVRENKAMFFCDAFAKQNNLSEAAVAITRSPYKEDDALFGSSLLHEAVSKPSPPRASPKAGIFSSIKKFISGKDDSKEWNKFDLTCEDFDFLKVVGRGAFGKVMQVRKKSDGCIYAMKILKKSEIIEKGQVEHTMAEKEILCQIDHPFIVCLRYSFQTKEKLYIITDYYNGGCLFFHLRSVKKFTEERAKFYCAELLSGLAHLHSQNIIYRDLKLENVLMDHQGHIALTDFGLSKQNVGKSGGATTFCGTAEYLAPELVLLAYTNKAYGPAVDWWSFGIILYEMVNGTTPFYNRNKKTLYNGIVHKEPQFPSNFSKPLVDVCKGLLTKDETKRLGCSKDGAREIMNSSFFSTIDFNALLRKEIKPPFKPEVTDEKDTKYVPKPLLDAEARDSYAAAPGKKAGASADFSGFTHIPDK